MPIQMEPRTELAYRLTRDAAAPEQAIRGVFEETIAGVAAIINIRVDDATKERVWNKIKTEKIGIIKTKLIHEFCTKILGSFSDDQIHTMLQEHRSAGAIVNPALLQALNFYQALYHGPIIVQISELAVQQMESITQTIIEDFIEENNIQDSGV